MIYLLEEVTKYLVPPKQVGFNFKIIVFQGLSIHVITWQVLKRVVKIRMCFGTFDPCTIKLCTDCLLLGAVHLFITLFCFSFLQDCYGLQNPLNSL